MGLVEFLDVILGWLTLMPMWLGLLILAALLTVTITLVQKLATDQSEMKRLKDRIKAGQTKMKAHKDDPKKMMKVQSEVMQANSEYMKKSLKPTLYTIIPFIILIAWINVHFSFAPVMALEPVTIQVMMEEPAEVTLSTDLEIQGEATKQTLEQQASWVVSGPEGRHELLFTTAGGSTARHEVVIGEEPMGPYIIPIFYQREGDSVRSLSAPFERAVVKYEKARPLGGFSIGNYHPGWLMTYFIFSLAISIPLRKLAKVY